MKLTNLQIIIGFILQRWKTEVQIAKQLASWFIT